MRTQKNIKKIQLNTHYLIKHSLKPKIELKHQKTKLRTLKSRSKKKYK